MAIRTIKGLYRYLASNSCFSGSTVHTVILHLGFHLWDSENEFKALSKLLLQCARKGADKGFTGFNDFTDTIPFFTKHRKDIVIHMEHTAKALGIDIISMVQYFGVFEKSKKPSISDVGKALWDSTIHEELNELYNVFAWYTLEEIARIWDWYVEENQGYSAELSA